MRILLVGSSQTCPDNGHKHYIVPTSGTSQAPAWHPQPSHNTILYA